MPNEQENKNTPSHNEDSSPTQSPQSEWDIQQLNKRQLQQSSYYNQHAHDLPTLKEGDVVRMKPFQLGNKEWKKRHDNIDT